MLTLSLTTPSEIIEGVAARLKRRRIDLNLTQRQLSERSGVSYSSLRLLEDQGKGSFEAVVKVAFALEAEGEFEALFPPKPMTTLQDIIGRPVRQRVRSK